jgi:hypothetical protein
MCIEHQLHLFRCENADVVETFHKSVQKLKRLTTLVFTAFTNMICKIARKPPLSIEPYCDDTQLVVEAQKTLGMESLIRETESLRKIQL